MYTKRTKETHTAERDKCQKMQLLNIANDSLNKSDLFWKPTTLADEAADLFGGSGYSSVGPLTSFGPVFQPAV